MKVRDLCLNALLALFSIGLGIAAMERASRLVGSKAETERITMSSDSVLGFIPSGSWALRLPNDSARAGSDAIEVNGDTVPIQKKGSEIRILFLGDSGTAGAGLGVGLPNSYPIQLRHDLEARLPGQDIRVINAGVPGMSTINKLQLFERHLSQLKPDIVILGLFMANDINFNLKHERALFHTAAPDIWHRIAQWGQNHSALVRGSTLALRALNIRVEVAPTIVDSSGFDFQNYLEGEAVLYRRFSSELTEHAFGLLEQLFERFGELAEKGRFRFGVVLIPTTSTLAEKLDMHTYPEASSILRQRGLEDDELDFDLPTRRVLEICRRTRISCFDPTPALRTIGTERAVLPNDDHPTILAHGILAETVINGILPWLEDGDHDTTARH